MTRPTAATAAVALAVAWAVLTASMVTIHSWRDITFGSNTAYCGLAIQSSSIDFYCQNGH